MGSQKNVKSIKQVAYFLYRFFGESDVVAIAKKRGINIDWVLEAGCHDGSDSVRLHENLHPERYLAFEPDETARTQAELTFALGKLDAIELYPYGLSNVNSMKYLKYEAEGKGSGSTHFADTGEDVVEIRVFDDHFNVHQSSGLLWLDVEGHTLQALDGMSISLQQIVIARVEVQLHTRSKDFIQDFLEVVKVMQKMSLIPVYGPIYPGYFGDIIFMDSNLLKTRDKLRSKFLRVLLKFLHLYFYPKIKKPSHT
jgi:FkbM family methyltransferase